MSEIKPLKSTQRVVEWDELPASAREVPEDFDPMDEGVFMRHQSDWVAINASLKVAQKGRRTGITFAEALDDTIIAASRRAAGGDNVFYIGDTKDKGLEFIGYCAHFARVIATAQGQGVSGIEEFLFNDQDEQGNSRAITSYRIRFASGFQITALSSRPANIRGLQGIVVIDEAAYHVDVEAVIDAATALLIWGGKIRVISTHNGTRNAFNGLIKDIESGRYGDDCQVFRVSFDDAVAAGLYERVCMMKRWTPSAEEKEKWYKRIRASYGPRKSAMRQELDVIPADGGGKSIPGVWIERAMREKRPVLRWTLDDDFPAHRDSIREALCEEWIERHLAPAMEDLDAGATHVAGYDFARHRHFSVIVPMAILGDLRRRVPFVLELANVPAAQQQQILFWILDRLPDWRGIAIDATGPGMVPAEYAADKFRDRVHQITLNRGWYGQWMPKMIERFEDDSYDLPADRDCADDLRGVEETDGVPMVAKPERRDLKEPELYRHGDFASALVLAEYAALNQVARKYEHRSTGRRASLDADEFQRTDRGFGTVGRRGVNFDGY